MAFVNFTLHEHALKFMKFVTQNRDAVIEKFGNRLPIIEFAIEDVRKIRRIEFRREAQREA